MKKIKFGKYIISVENARKLEEVARIRMSGPAIVLCVSAVLLIAAGLGTLIMGLSPLKRNLPGYLTAGNRQEAIRTAERLDSIQLSYATNQRFLDNLTTILNTDREPTDSLNAGDFIANPLSLDSLLESSDSEKEFVAMMNERERFNLSVLSPLAADGLIFTHPSDGGIIAEESKKSYTIKVIPPKGIGVNAMCDGIVVDTYSEGDGTYTILIQHPKGFLSKYSKLGVPLVDKGVIVSSGQRLSEGMGKHQRYALVNLWRNGTRLYPTEYIRRRQSVTEDDHFRDVTSPH